ncbi:tenascin-like isoform X2 [Hyposmocoma kahamanoa]|uniref:tenascin-like isoform X2 n=1 Tax=Hyposmocoma kahamanoa TaxID=1477025 RepID=UPI000E6D9FB7|nr:tenascin-like isoform X2 [Hyposmocoma kahamanoa]
MLKVVLFVAFFCAVNAHVTVNVFSDEDPQLELKSCSPLNCDQTCRRLGFPGGVCVNGKCKCDIIKSAEDPVVEVKSCSPSACAQNCRHIGFPGGTCVNGKCKCDIIKSADNIKTSDLAFSCNGLSCFRFCTSMGFLGGNCVGDQCMCHGKKDITSNEMPTVDNDLHAEGAESPLPLETSQQMSVKKPKCVFKYCLQACVLYGYISGYCDANDTCKCVK